MNRFALAFFVLLPAVTLAAPQVFHGDPSLAKIIQEQRFNLANSQFGHAAEQEDGVIIREESKQGNNRVGQYQYVGDDGKLYTVKYEAGVNGFRILEGSHIPSGGQNAAAAAVASDGEIEEYDYAYYDETPDDLSPFVNPYDRSHHQPALLAGNLAGHLAGLYREPEKKPEVKDPRLAVLLPEERNRFFPPGELKFDRFADGFNFKFRSQ